MLQVVLSEENCLVTHGPVNFCFKSLSPTIQLDNRGKRSAYRQVKSWCHPAWFLVGLIAASSCAFSQTGGSAVSVTVGMTTPVVGKEFTAYTLVTNHVTVPAPNGSVEFDFGDGTPTVRVAMNYRIATATHTYSSVGPAKVTATYSGDSNFAPASATLQGQVVRSVSSATLNIYGDSISYSWDLPAPTGSWVQIVGYIEGWRLNPLAFPGHKVADQTPIVYAAKVAPDTYSAVLLGQNDFNANSVTDPQYITQYQNSLLAVATWLLIPDTDGNGTHPKIVAQDQSVTKNGGWIPSSLYPTMGLTTTEAGDSITSTVTGSTVYVGLSGILASDYTVDIYVDGAMAGRYNPSIVYSGSTTSNIPLAIRIPVPGGASTDSHIVTTVCKSPGSSGCFVDWFAGNGFVAPNKLPLLWLGEPYHSNQPGWTYQTMLPYMSAIRQIGHDLQADGLGITLADVFDNFDGQLEPQCLVDQVHPAECGHEIIAATFSGAMDWLFTRDQRIDFGSQNSATFSTAPIPVNVSATSGLPVKLNVLSGPATLVNGGITPSAIGSVTMTANQEGDANYRPAAPEQTTIQILPALVTISVVPSSTHVIAPGVISVSTPVTWTGTGAVTGNVTLYDGNTAIGVAPLDATGAATFAGMQLPLGDHVLIAKYSQQGNFANGISAPVDISVVYPPADLQITKSANGAVVAAGQQVSFSLSLQPSLGFTPTTTFSCDGLPALSSCQFSQNPMPVGAGGGIVTVTVLTTGPHLGQASVTTGSLSTTHGGGSTLVLAGALWTGDMTVVLLAFFRKHDSRGPRKRGAGIVALFLLFMLPGTILNGCGRAAPSTPPGMSSITVSAIAVQGAASITRDVQFQLKVTK